MAGVHLRRKSFVELAAFGFRIIYQEKKKKYLSVFSKMKKPGFSKR